MTFPIYARAKDSGVQGPPSIRSLSQSVADTDGGGNAITIAGNNFAGTTAVTIGGTAVTSFTVVDSQTMTFVPAARAAGAGLPLVITTPAGQSSGATFEYWTPAQLSGADLYFDSGKGVVGSITTWTDQKNAVVATPTNSPTLVASVFGTLPAIRFSPQAYFDFARRNDDKYDAGVSIFAVVKWTATTTTVNQGFGVVPMSLHGDQNAGNAAFGASDGNLAYSLNGSATIGTRGSGFNTGAPLLVGVTYLQSTNAAKVYVGTVQQGATDTGQTYPGATGMGITTIGNGFGYTDGWNGDIGAFIVTTGTPLGAAELARLNAWAQQRFGTP